MNKANFKRTLMSCWHKLTGPYYCLLPFGAAIVYNQHRRMLVSDFDTLCSMTDLQDDVYKVLSTLQFKIDAKHHDLRALQPRGAVCPDSKQVNAVELDSMIWISDKLRPIQKYFEQYDIGGDIIATATYIEREDNVLFTLQSIRQSIIEDMQRFISINKTTTIMWLIWLSCIVTTICTILQ